MNMWDWEEITKKIEIKPEEKKDDYCFHFWVDYTGLMEKYQYCKVCNKKRDSK